MKVFIDDNKIKIRRKEGVVLVIDSGVPFDLFEIVKNQVRDMDIPLRIGALSHDKEINENAIQNLGHILINRGRFINPLIEGFFSELIDKEYDLIVLHSGRVYDIDDYKTELPSKFGRILTKDVSEKQNLTEAEWITFFESEIFDFSIGNIELSLNSAVPLEWGDNFGVSLDTSKKQFVLKKSISNNDKKWMDIYLGTRGRTQDADIKVKVNDLIFSEKVKSNTNFTMPQWKHLSSNNNDEQIFWIHLNKYKENIFEVECPLCRKKHTFEKPFFCSKQSGDILLGQLAKGALILKDLSSYQKGFVFFRSDGNRVTYLTPEKDGLEFEELRFIFVLNGQVYEVICRDRSLEIKEGDKIHSNLYELGKGDIVYLL